MPQAAVPPPSPVGRATETDELVAVLDAARRSGAALVLRGDTGIGKSTLPEWASVWWRSQGARLLHVVGSEAENVVPYAGLRRLLAPLVDHVDALPPRSVDVLHRVFGYGTAAVHAVHDPDVPEPPEVPEVFAVALAALDLVTLPRVGHPLLVTVDDAHALDDPTAQVLGFVARRLESDPVVMLLATRSPGEPEALAGVPVLDVLPLAEQDAGRVLDARCPALDPAVREVVLDQAAGNPLALVALPAGLADVSPEAPDTDLGAVALTVRIERALVRHVDHLGPTTLAALLVAATDNQADVEEILAATGHLVGRDLDETVLAPAVRRGLVTLGQDALVRFAHPLLASALRDRAGATRRRDAHLALAAVASTPNRRLAHRAVVAVGVDDGLADELAAAALRARRLGAPGSAVTPLTRSARLTSEPARRIARLVEAAEVASSVGRSATASRLLDEAAELDLDRLDQIRIALVRAQLHDDRLPERPGTDRLIALADEARSLGDGELAVALLAVGAQHCWWVYPDATTRLALTDAIRRLPTAPLDARVLAMLVQAAPMEENPEVRRRLARRGRGTGDGFLLGMASYVVTDYAASASLLEQAGTELRAQGRLASVAGVQTMLAYTEFERGAWDAALEAAEEGLGLTRESRNDEWLGPALTVTSMLAGLHGDEGRADRLDAEADRVLRARGDTNIQGVLRTSRGRRAAHRDDPETAEALLAPLFDREAADFNPRSCIPAIFPLADTTPRGRQAAESRLALIRSFVEDTARVDPYLPPGLVTAAAYAEAVLGPEHEADRRFLDAQHRAADRPFDRARLEVAHAHWLRLHRQTEPARRVLRRAHGTFVALGNTPLATRTARSLSQLGDEVDRSRGGAWQSLTPQEGQIARLVAEGLSNREIGQQLFLSHRTVGSHLYRVFPKLGITSRVELARFVLGLGLGPRPASEDPGHRPGWSPPGDASRPTGPSPGPA